MLQEITNQNINKIKNPIFQDYAAMYLDIFDGFISQVEKYGLPFDKTGNYMEEAAELIKELKQNPEITARCDDASLVYKRISTACEACKQGVGTITSYISFKCHRKCFFCFNPNQDNYEAHVENKQNWKNDLITIKHSGGNLTHIALTGGEPLLYPEEAVEFVIYARTMFPDAHIRLYTSGDLLTKEMCAEFKKAGLDEIRFSYKMEDTKTTKKKVLANMKRAKKYIPTVMVEMPVMPDCEEEMKELLVSLADIGVWCINLLELCFPYNNAEAFNARGFKLKYPPYRTLYNFWYAGGLPVANSELVALRLMKFAADNNLDLGIHYCSLENKNFGQMYQQNHVLSEPQPSMMFSEKDYYLKTIKAFGNDALAVLRLFEKRNLTGYLYNAKAGYIQFHPDLTKHLKGRSAELALSVNVAEYRDNEVVTRELKLMRADFADCLPENL